ncbi:hypothetical protein GGH95_001250, partial [Coemansia sp. RSA 1836]
MHTFTPFQLLPEHVVELVVNHVVNNSRSQLGKVGKDSYQYKRLQMPLLWVCHNFRAFVYMRFCSHCKLDMRNYEDEVVASSCSWPGPLGNPTHSLAKVLDLSLDLWSIYTGKALRQLSSDPYDGCAFPQARKLSIDIALNSQDSNDYPAESDDDSSVEKRKICSQEAVANIAALVSRLKEMMPMVGKVSMSCTTAVEKLLSRRDARAMRFAQQLFNALEVTTVVMDDRDSLDCCIDLEPVSNLVDIHFTVFCESTAVIPLARRSAQTLQTLYIYLNVTLCYSEIIRDPSSGNYAEYPRLHRLTIIGDHDSAASRKLAFSGAVPFPNLRHLCIDGGYPFDDDVLFRGNSSTLEYLEVALHPATVVMFKRLNVFTPTSHSKLQCVNIASLVHHAPVPFATANAYMEFVLSIAPGASVRTISNLFGFDGALWPALALLGNCTTIQVLSITDTQLSFWDIASIIKVLPLLSDLHTASPTIGEHPQGIDVAELPEYVCSTYAPMSQRFRCWHLDDIGGIDWAELATCVLLLAFACPSFECADV